MNKTVFKLLLLISILSLSITCSHKIKYSYSPIPPISSLDSLTYHYHPENVRLPLQNHTLTTSLVAVGDIMIGEHVTDFLDKYGHSYPFDSTKHIIQAVPFAIGNLEAPFSKTGVRFDKKYTFKIDPRYADGLVEAGFDVLNLANNHMMDYGHGALINTLSTLDSLNLYYSGAGINKQEAMKPAFVTQNNITIAFIGCSMTYPVEFWAKKDSAGTFYPYEKDLKNQIQSAQEKAEFVVVSFHWGQELRDTPKEYQRHFAHLSIDNGADLVLGHHPHILQGIEVYNDKLIVYSLGNFAFGSYSGKAKDSIIFKIHFAQNGFYFAKIIPISVLNHEVKFQPKIVKGNRQHSIITHLNTISFSLNRNRNIIDENGYIWGNWTDKYFRK